MSGEIRWSPLQIGVLLHAYSMADPHPMMHNKVHMDAHDTFESMGIIKKVVDRGGCYTTTDKGYAMVMLILSTSEPQKAYVDPRDDKVINWAE